MRKVKHWSGYGTVKAEKIPETGKHVLHVRVIGNHEQGLRPRWNDLAYDWLVHRFDRSAPDRYDPTRMGVTYEEGFVQDPEEPLLWHESCEFYFYY